MLGLCRSVWVVEACQFFLVPSRSSNMPLYPSKMLGAKEHASIPYFVFYSGFTFESLKELGARHQLFKWESTWECVGYSLTLSHTFGNVNVIPRFHYPLAPIHVLALVTSPRLGSWHWSHSIGCIRKDLSLIVRIRTCV